MKINRLETCLAISFSIHFIGLIALFAASLLQGSVTPQTIKAMALTKITEKKAIKGKEQDKKKEKPLVQAVMIDHKKVQQHVKRIKEERKQARIKENQRKKRLERELRSIRQAALKEKQKISKLANTHKKHLENLEQAEHEIKLAQVKKAHMQDQMNKTRKIYDQELKRIQKERQRLKKEAEEKENRLKQQVVLEKKLREQLAEEKKREAKEAHQKVKAEISRYRAMIQSTIKRNLILQESMRGKECVVQLDLAEDGFVTRIKRLSGNAVVCRQAEAAIHKSRRLPVSPNPLVYSEMKNINLTIKPEFN
tara:strand:+ start:599 stop:1525 length:927 start_codon:yes stop_codon:yes gene_type:complete